MLTLRRGLFGCVARVRALADRSRVGTQGSLTWQRPTRVIGQCWCPEVVTSAAGRRPATTIGRGGAGHRTVRVRPDLCRDGRRGRARRRPGARRRSYLSVNALFRRRRRPALRLRPLRDRLPPLPRGGSAVGATASRRTRRHSGRHWSPAKPGTGRCRSTTSGISTRSSPFREVAFGPWSVGTAHVNPVFSGSPPQHVGRHGKGARCVGAGQPSRQILFRPQGGNLPGRRVGRRASAAPDREPAVAGGVRLSAAALVAHRHTRCGPVVARPEPLTRYELADARQRASSTCLAWTRSDAGHRYTRRS